MQKSIIGNKIVRGRNDNREKIIIGKQIITERNKFSRKKIITRQKNIIIILEEIVILLRMPMLNHSAKRRLQRCPIISKVGTIYAVSGSLTLFPALNQFSYSFHSFGFGYGKSCYIRHPREFHPATCHLLQSAAPLADIVYCHTLELNR